MNDGHSEIKQNSSTQSSSALGPAPRSKFLNRASIYFIIVNVFFTFAAIYQNILFHSFFSPERRESMLLQLAAFQVLPYWMLGILQYFHFFLATYLLVEVIALFASFGLRRRESWARYSLLVWLSLWNVFLCSVIVLQILGPRLLQISPDDPMLHDTLKLRMIGGLIPALIMLLNFYLIYRLGSASLKNECRFGWRELARSEGQAQS